METIQSASPISKNRANRSRINNNVINFNRAFEETKSERAAARATGLPRTTAQYHAKRQRDCDLDHFVMEFFQSNSGMTFLNQLVLAIEFVLSQLGHCGLRLIQRLYELSKLDRLVACSLGTLSERVKQMETNMSGYSQKQEARLVETMAPNPITCCLDETFPSGICLVGIEPVSNFILLEEMAAKRDAITWAEAMDKRLANLPITVMQVTSDEAKALIKYTEQHLDAHHSPDLFHIQQEVSKASAVALRAKVKKARSTADKTASALDSLKNQRAVYEAQEEKPVGRPTDYNERQEGAEIEHEYASHEVEKTEHRREAVRVSNKAIGESYHPFDMATGQKREPEGLRSELNTKFDRIESTLEDAQLSVKSFQRVAKARRMIDSMVDTLEFYWVEVNNRVKSLALDKALEKIFVGVLLPAVYIEIHAAKAGTADLRTQRAESSARLHEQLERDIYWRSLTDDLKNKLKKLAAEYAQIFQRSSSNVEGRNGQISLHHHIYKNMSAQKLHASTIIHNYFIQRKDGTTAAERFFGKAPEPLFEHLLRVTDFPAAPAKKRSIVRLLNTAA